MQETAVWLYVSTGCLIATLCASGDARAYTAGDVNSGGRLVGTVTFDGKVPPPTTVRVTKDQAVCGKTKTGHEIVVGPGRTLMNAVVYLEGIQRGKAASSETVVVDQKQCVYTPHVVTATRRSKVEIRNSDGVLHNVHGVVGARDVFNIAMPTRGQRTKKKLKKAGLIKLNCDAGHTWMNGYIYVFDHPYHTVTPKSGAFEITGIPPGQYKLSVWHEKLGRLSRTVTIPTGGEARATLTYRK